MKLASLLAIVLAISQFVFAQTTRTEQGTLIFVVTTKDGVVTCADRRKTLVVEQSLSQPLSAQISLAPETTYTDDTYKVFKLSDHVLYATTGVMYFQSEKSAQPSFLSILPGSQTPLQQLLSSSNRTVFDLHREVALFYSGVEFDGTDAQLARLSVQLLGKLNPIRRQLINNEHYQAPFNLMFCRLDSDGKLVWKLLRPRLNSSGTEYTMELVTVGESEQALVFAMGSTTLYDELLKPDSSLFPDLRTNSKVSPFIVQPLPNRADVSRFKAAEFAKLLIAETNHNSKELEKLRPGQTVMVSESCNCVLLDANGVRDFTDEKEPEPVKVGKKTTGKKGKRTH